MITFWIYYISKLVNYLLMVESGETLSLFICGRLHSGDAPFIRPLYPVLPSNGQRRVFDDYYLAFLYFSRLFFLLSVFMEPVVDFKSQWIHIWPNKIHQSEHWISCLLFFNQSHEGSKGLILFSIFHFVTTLVKLRWVQRSAQKVHRKKCHFPWAELNAQYVEHNLFVLCCVSCIKEHMT